MDTVENTSVDRSRRLLLKMGGASAAVSVATTFNPFGPSASAEEQASEGTGEVREVLTESGSKTGPNQPSFDADYVGVYGMSSSQKPTLEVESGGSTSSMELPLDPAGKSASGKRATALRRVPSNASYTMTNGSGTPVAVNTSSGKLKARSRQAEKFPMGDDGPRYFSRRAWGGDDVEALRFDEDGNDRWGSDPSYFPVQKITVHHTATDNNDPDPVSTVNAIYNFHTLDLAFGDIGFNLLIDEDGSVYEGRFSSNEPIAIPGHQLMTDVSPPELLAVQAAHVGGFNSGNFGIALIGNFSEEGAQATRASVASLTKVLAALCAVHRLDPQGSELYTNPVNALTAEDIPNIAGSRDWAATESPGSLFDELPDIRSDVASILNKLSL